ncbi:Viral A-type inclusion protein repeat containing protein [Planoprotostelium fungivorum]|uniref:Viral A-type inclusion protein repeat containing protein n=1 Tax=Planoprotostelium fungivorum TaxID=1890364 RepID=A0A2P6MW74_9EUKA|nr:Viral A-type inclusion protein repeat containing protein [Planoprotostelium fungivorum]
MILYGPCEYLPFFSTRYDNAKSPWILVFLTHLFEKMIEMFSRAKVGITEIQINKRPHLTAIMERAGTENIKVCVRVRPMNSKELSVNGKKCITVDTNANMVRVHGDKAFTFDWIAGEDSTQESIFIDAAKPITDTCLSGYNGTIFAYGQTGSGKTFTIGGVDSDDAVPHPQRGLVARVLEYIFVHTSRAERNGVEFLCKCSYFEIYNEHITDLLNPSDHGLNIREDMRSGVYVENLVQERVTTVQDALQLIRTGNFNRKVGSTAANSESSRSHSVLTLSIQSRESRNSVTSIKTSKLNIIDLAGSERQKNTDATGVRLKEAGSINKSLSALGNVIRALVDVGTGLSRHVAYRDSKLTFFLRDSLGGNSKCTMIATVSPSDIHYAETLSTLKFAQRAKLIKNQITLNEDTSGGIAALQVEIQQLKQKLHNAQLTYVPVSTQDFPADRITEMEKLILSCTMRNGDYRKSLEESHETIDQLNSVISGLNNEMQRIQNVLKFRNKPTGRSTNEQINDLEKIIKEMQQQINNNPNVLKLQLENKNLRAQISFDQSQAEKLGQLSQYLNQLEEHLRILTEEKDHLESQIQEMGGGNEEQLLSEIERQEQEMLRIQNERNLYEDRAASLEKQLNEYDVQMKLLVENTTKSKAAKDKTIRELQARLLEKEKGVDVTANEEKERWSRAVKSSEEETNELREKMEAMSREMSQRANRVQELEDLLRETKRELESSKNSINEDRRKSLTRRMSVMPAAHSSTTNRNMEGEIFRLEMESKSKDTLIAERSAELSSLREEMDTTVSSYEYKLKTFEELVGQLKSEVEAKREVERLLTARDEAIAVRDEQIDRQTRLIEGLRNDEEKKSSEIALELNNENRKLREEIAILEEEAVKLQSTIDEIRTQLSNREETIVEINQQLESSQKDYTTAQECVLHLRQTSQNQDSTILSLTSQLEEVKKFSETSEASNRLGLARLEQVMSQQKVSEEKHLSDMREEKERSMREEEILKEKVSSLEKECRELQEEMERARESQRERLTQIQEEHRVSLEQLKTQMVEGDQAQELVLKSSEIHQLREELKNMEAERETSEKKVLDLEDEANELDRELQKKDADIREYETMNTDLQTRIFELSEEARTVDARLRKTEEELKNVTSQREVESRELNDQILRFKSSEQMSFEESERLREKLNISDEEKMKMTREHEYLKKQLAEAQRVNSDLVGHHNQKQKIQHHARVKNENNRLKMERMKMMEAVTKMDNEARAKGFSFSFKPKELLAAIHDKENDSCAANQE